LLPQVSLALTTLSAEVRIFGFWPQLQKKKNTKIYMLKYSRFSE